MDGKVYVDKAVECMLLAESLRDPEERLQLLQLAQHYLLLAELVGARRRHGSPEQPEGQGADNDS